MRRVPLVLFVLLAVAHPLPLHASLVLTNGEFTGNLNSWTASGMVFNTGDTGVFSDSVASPTSLFQSGVVAGNLISVELSFDIFNGLSPTIPDGFFPDSFFATLYFGSSAFGPALIGGNFDQAVVLYDLDASGPFNVAAGATFGTSPKGAGWTRYALTYQTSPGFTGPGYVTAAFEFYNLNGTASDSVVAIDNVTLNTVVPEPSQPLLISLTTVGLLLRRSRNSCSMPLP